MNLRYRRRHHRPVPFTERYGSTSSLLLTPSSRTCRHRPYPTAAMAGDEASDARIACEIRFLQGLTNVLAMRVPVHRPCLPTRTLRRSGAAARHHGVRLHQGVGDGPVRDGTAVPFAWPGIPGAPSIPVPALPACSARIPARPFAGPTPIRHRACDSGKRLTFAAGASPWPCPSWPMEQRSRCRGCRPGSRRFRNAARFRWKGRGWARPGGHTRPGRPDCGGPRAGG